MVVCVEKGKTGMQTEDHGRMAELEENMAKVNPGLFGNMISVATTPLRAAAGLVRDKVRDAWT